MIPFPDKKYQIIYADPPWSYKDKKCNGAALNHYETMKIEDICNLPVQGIMDDNCILFMWATYPLLKEALQVIEAWGFKYKSIAFQWVKVYPKSRGYVFGLGRWTRGNTEPCLIATKGKPKRVDNAISQLIVSPIRKHSEKPPEARHKIVKLVGDLPRIELFSRTIVKGWDMWGNEVPNYEQLEMLEG
jgi:N6-adenosine-specific RNA methylase IME4